MRARQAGRSVEILFVDDSAGDALSLQAALAELSVPVRLTVARDGESALRLLRRSGKEATTRRPDMILLDLDLPKVPGLEVLARVKRDPELRRIPIVIFTTSESEDDVARSYDLHANCYMVKPQGLSGFSDALRTLELFWLSSAELPVG